ncbi:MAG TPA: ABC transporter substrate-binding protein [Methylomusa anaerophila]|uniref:Putative aliphatic sulfonates-binding protein n=1 Tax=Methylomusa anaerophila TaxID=1930071 RepID=A0A348AEX5_9FIRM|nr:ABC transporter substrate-binding protein [Methylomusa anaerophila]BBB89623.1 putative aliphatic sulfonates-binding protein precursor [Methylomusa anaerophila]HML89604.1 ABC transporter substrate-binding protein [Methylomusa anaerophila]
MNMRTKVLGSKVAVLILLALMIMLVLAGCGKKEEHAVVQNDKGALEKTEIKYQGWASQVLFPELAEDLGYLAPLKLKWVGNTISGPQDIQSVATGDIDFGGAFTGAIVNLKASNAPIKYVIGYYGVDDKSYYALVVNQDSPLKDGRDFIGKKIAVNTPAAHNEFIIKEYLRKQGLTEAEIKQVTLAVLPPVNAEQALRQGQVDGAILGGMFKDKAFDRGGVRTVFTDYDIFGKFTGGGYVFTEKFIRDNPNTVRKFVEATAKAIEWAKATPREEVIARMEKIIKERKRNEDASTVNYWRSTGVSGKGGLASDTEIQMWIDWLVKEGKLKAGQIKPSDVYTNEFNPYVNEK